MNIFSKVYGTRNRKTSGGTIIRGVVIITFLMSVAYIALFAACAASRVSYTAQTLYHEPRFYGRMLSNNDIAVLPLLNAYGVVTSPGELEAEAMVKRLGSLRPDLKFVSYETFEAGFTARIDTNRLATFYKTLFKEEILAVKNMDDLWAEIKQPYFLVFTLTNGAVIRNIDESVFKRVDVMCELWDCGRREVVWRSVSTGVTDDARVTDSELIVENMRRLVAKIPPAPPGYGQGSW